MGKDAGLPLAAKDKMCFRQKSLPVTGLNFDSCRNQFSFSARVDARVIFIGRNFSTNDLILGGSSCW